MSTFENLGLKQRKTKPKEGSVLWSASQYVEPLRDGEPWCTWEHAEEMLAEAAKAAMRGQSGVAADQYHLVRDEDAMTLTLELI